MNWMTRARPRSQSRKGPRRLACRPRMLSVGEPGRMARNQIPVLRVRKWRKRFRNRKTCSPNSPAISDELKKILDNLEGSTFVKRLKAASRRQLEVAGDLNKNLLDSFGVCSQSAGRTRTHASRRRVAKREDAQSESVYIIQEDSGRLLQPRAGRKIQDRLERNARRQGGRVSCVNWPAMSRRI